MLPPRPSDGSIASILMDRIRTLNARDRQNAQAPFSDTGATAAPFTSPDGPSFSDLLRNFGAPVGTDPEYPIQPAPPLEDDEEQANLRALDARLSSTGDIRDAVALCKARRASWR